MRRIVHFGMLLAGVGLTAWLLWSVGLAALASNLSAVGAWWLVCVGLYLFAQLAFMMGWWVVMDPHVQELGFLKLFAVYLAGDTVNYLVPSGNLGGEPVKAYLLRDRLGLGRAFTSIVIHKHAELVAQWLLLAGGLAVCMALFRFPGLVTVANAVIVVGLGGSLVVMTWVLIRGTMSPLLRRMAGWRLVASYLASFQPAADALVTRVQGFYAERGRWVVIATGWCFIGWCGGLVETYLILRLFSPSNGWSTAIAVETMAMAFNNLFAFVPARLGSAEGVRTGVFVLLGLPAAQGVAYGIVRRARELVWILPGLVFLWGRYFGWSESTPCRPLTREGGYE